MRCLATRRHNIECALTPPHNSIHTCPHPRTKDGSGCICDLRKWSKSNSDWPIASVVGSATYAHLLDSSPGLYEPFTDFRSCGYAASANAVPQKSGMFRIQAQKSVSKEDEAPPPPNFVSTVLAEGAVSPADLKRRLIVEAAVRLCKPGLCTPEASDNDGYLYGVEPATHAARLLVGTSHRYRSPELNLGEVFAFFLTITLVVAIVISSVCTIRSEFIYGVR